MSECVLVGVEHSDSGEANRRLLTSGRFLSSSGDGAESAAPGIHFGEAANLVRLLRIGRIFKLVKLLRIIKLNKISQSSYDFFDVLISCVSAGESFAWFAKFLFGFLLMTHLLACSWLIVGKFETDHNAWTHAAEDDMDPTTLYITSFYFIITTITTVGYGDFSGATNIERIMNCVIMFIGSISFAYASGLLTNWIINDTDVIPPEKMATLDRL